MCGIAGVLNLTGNGSIGDGIVCQMCDAIIHRGPDDYGCISDGPLSMGMRRLAIIDIEQGKQPISNEDGTVWIVFNGEIYNHLDLKKELQKKEHIFRTKTDTETILHLYEEKGVGCLQDLRGMFAFAIWDKSKRRLFIARDRLGIKPLFWGQIGKWLYFSSEMKSLFQLPFLQTDIDYNGFDAFFTYGYIPAPLTIYKSIQKLHPAHYVLVENGSCSVHKYWDVRFNDKFTGRREEIDEEFNQILSNSVKMRLMSEVPLGAFLSGGIDSGLILALMSRESSKPARAFTIGFLGETGDFLDERPYAREIAERYNCRYREIMVKPQISQAMDAAVTAFDEPFADDSIIPTYNICAEAKKELTVILTGLGGDENFAGYERYLGLWMSRFFEKVPVFLRDRVITPLVLAMGEEKGGHYRISHLKRFVTAGSLPPPYRYQSYVRALSPRQRRSLYTPDIARLIDFDYVEFLGRRYFEHLDEGDILDRALYQDLNMYLPDDILALSDRIGMFHSLELRAPFVDHKLVEFCARIPSKWKINLGRKKYFLKKSANKYLSSSVINHRKQGFCSPMASWIRRDLKDTVNSELSDTNLETIGFFKPAVVGQIIKDHYELKCLNDKVIFSLLMFQKWFNQKQTK